MTEAKVLRPIGKSDAPIGYCFWCPACDIYHAVNIEPGGWTFNGDEDKPTFSPSILFHGDENGFGGFRCHSFVRDGQIQYLTDCTHDLAGKTVPLPLYPIE